MKRYVLPVICLSFIIACNTQTAKTEQSSQSLPLQGTWKLLKGTLIEKGDTTVTDYTKNISFIKVINADHFAFLQHNLDKDSATGLNAGGGPYTLQDSTYKEHLEYCGAKEWEGTDFSFTITIHNDTLVQRGIEKLDKAGVNRMNTEVYVRLKK